MAAARTKNIKFRTMLHILPYHNPLVSLAAMIHEFSILTDGRYEFGVGRGHGWIPTAAGLPLDETSRERYEEALDLFIEALHNDTVTFHGKYWNVDDSHIIPFSGESSASSSAARPTARTTSPRSTAGASPSRRCSRTRR